MAATNEANASPTVSAMALCPSLPTIHNAGQEVRNLRQILEEDKQRIGCFLGAGCPLGIYDENGEKSIVLIPDIKALTLRVSSVLESRDRAVGSKTTFKKAWDSLCKECKGCEEQNECSDCKECKHSNNIATTVEDVLTELRTLSSRRGNTNVLGITKQDLNKLDDEICGLVKDVMAASLPSYRCSYNRFASWIGGVARLFPVEIFTPNYDLLFEEAFERQSLPHFDGFVGTREPWFDLASIEHDAIPSRWTRLWKLHGSINWKRIEEKKDGRSVTRVVRVTGVAEGKVMIYPSHLKYDQSRRMPYLAMLDRLRAFFRGDVIKRGNIDNRAQDAPRLVICGYSFVDDHFNEVLLDGLRGNLKAHCVALMYSNLADHPRAVDHAKSQANLTVLAKDGAVIGTRVGRYIKDTGENEHGPWLYEDEVESTDPANGEKQTRCRLGDFHYFGLFLEQLCGGSKHNDQESV